MARYAKMYDIKTGTWKLVDATDLEEKDRNADYRCAACDARTYLVLSAQKGNHFRSMDHVRGCPDATDAQTISINSSTRISLDGILNHVDSDPVEKLTIPASPQENTDDTFLDDREGCLDMNGVKVIRSVSAMYRECMQRCGSDTIDDFSRREIQEIFLNEETLYKFKHSWGDPLKLVVAKPCKPPQDLRQRITNDYVILRDAFTPFPNDPIYFAVKLLNKKRDELFRQQIFSGKKSGATKPRNLAILARWKRVNHPKHQVYKAVLNTRMIAFVRGDMG